MAVKRKTGCSSQPADCLVVPRDARLARLAVAGGAGDLGDDLLSLGNTLAVTGPGGDGSYLARVVSVPTTLVIWGHLAP